MIQTKVKLTDNTRKIAARNALATDMAMAHMGQDVETIIKTGGKTPFAKTGFLRSQTRHEKVNPLHWRVISPVEYATVQERGRAGNKVFRTYTTPGTGRGWFQSAVESVVKNRVQYIREGLAANRL